MLQTVLKSIDSISRWSAAIAVLLIWGIVVLIVSEVFLRRLLGISISFAWEYSAYFYAIAVFGGAAFTMRTGGHVRVALFKGMLGEKANYAMDLVATGIGTAVSIFLAYSLSTFAWRSFENGSVSPTINATPLVVPQGALAIALIILSLQMIARCIRLVTGESVEDEEAKNSFKVD